MRRNGKTVANQEKHVNVKPCSDTDASRLINDRHFHTVGDNINELEMTNTISLNLPIQIGFFVYQYAQLRMLKF